MAKIGVVGWGVVGQAVGNGFATKSTNEVFWFDRKGGPWNLDEVINKSEIIFLCLPTPMFDDESGIDLSIIDDVVGKIAPKIAGREKVLVIKSTVVPGTTVSYAKKYPKVHFAMNPEFLTEANAPWDFLNPDRTVIGVLSQPIAAKLVQLYQDLLGYHAKIFVTDPTTAEMVKYVSNAFLATKVIFANEMYDLCSALGIKYEEVKDMVAADMRIGQSHFNVTTIRGFGGKCFPKDMVALIGFARDKMVDHSLLSTVWEKNLRIRKIRDWEEIKGAVNKKTSKKKKRK
ncbi:UDP-glucose/GDP-mannose dehydrogenase family protein [Candidatus Woesebacteria bacterium]|nr:UDP-glucose/GDP-mannose dehydrogenase family protein [Candidatus Woesebacteria bacterium]